MDTNQLSVPPYNAELSGNRPKHESDQPEGRAILVNGIAGTQIRNVVHEREKKKKKSEKAAARRALFIRAR